MKNLILFTLIIIFISHTGCEEATEPALPRVCVSFEIESAFQDDSVELVLDNKILAKSRVTTNYTISLAWSSGLQKLSKDDHKLHFSVVENNAEKDYLIDTSNDTSTVLLRFNRNTEQISINQIKGRIFRD
jgi:hypothetical protein